RRPPPRRRRPAGANPLDRGAPPALTHVAAPGVIGRDNEPGTGIPMKHDMRRLCAGIATFAIAFAMAPVNAGDTPASGATATKGAVVHTEDVALFYRVYDAANGHPTAAQLQLDYLDQGSDGLHVLARERKVTGQRIADM